MITSKRVAATLAGLVLAVDAHAGSCSAASTERTVALAELYTSEGCDSCPPADRWLSSLGTRGYAPDRVVPIALHVDYWDYIGWKDPYAKREFSTRQRELAQLQRLKFVYTPQVLLQGQDFRRWGAAAFEDAVARINARPARAKITVSLSGPGVDGFEVEVHANVLDASQRESAALYLAAYENRLVSQVTAGENHGKTLTHDYVVLDWVGPISLGPGGRAAERRRLPLLPGAVPANSGVVAFVQNRASGDVLQALMRPACPG
jgi:hypothetical protein